MLSQNFVINNTSFLMLYKYILIQYPIYLLSWWPCYQVLCQSQGVIDIYLCSCCCCHGDCRTQSHSPVHLWYSIQPGSICIGQQLRANNKLITAGSIHVSRTVGLDCFAGKCYTGLYRPLNRG